MHGGDAGQGGHRLAHGRQDPRVVHVDMGDLVVGHREGTRGPGVEHVAPEFVLYRQPPVGTQHPVQVDGACYRDNAVFGHHHHADSPRFEELDQLARHRVDGGQFGRQGRVGGAEFLQRVIEVGQVNEVEGGGVPLLDPARGPRDPPAAGDPRSRAPERPERERPQLVGPLDLEPQVRRGGVDVEDLAPVRRIHRPRGEGEFDLRVHVVPPEDLGGRGTGARLAQAVPDLPALDDLVRLLPELDLAQLAVVPAVADHAVAAGALPGDERGLRAAGQRREGLGEGRHARAAGEGGQPGHVAAFKVAPGEADHIEHREARAAGVVHPAARPVSWRWTPRAGPGSAPGQVPWRWAGASRPPRRWWRRPRASRP